MVIAVDLSPNKLELAKQLGATHSIKGDEQDAVEKILEITGGLGVDVALECVGLPALMQQAYQAVRPMGRAVASGVAPPDQEVALNAFDLVTTGKCMCGHKAAGSGANSGQFISSLLGQYQAGNLDLDTLVSQTYALDDVSKAVEDLLANANARGVFVFK